MSLMGQLHVGPVEAENPSRTKQFNNTGMQQSVKKKALADVKNIIHQKSSQSSTKSSNTSVKSTLFSGQNLFDNGEKLMTEKMNMKKVKDINGPIENGISILNSTTVEQEYGDAHTFTCKCDEIPEFDDADLLFEGLKLTNNEIENYALNWEIKPVLTPENKVDLTNLLEEFEPIPMTFDLEIQPSLEIKIPQLEVPVPPLFFEDSDEILNESFGCSIGL